MGLFKKDKIKDKVKKDAKKKASDLYSISSDLVRIKVYSDFGGNVHHLKVDFNAIEKKSEGGGIFFENEKFKFVKDIDFTKADVYKNIELLLKLNSKDRDGKIAYLKEKINYQQRLVGYLTRFVKLNAIKNHADESLKLHDYEVLLDHIERNGEVGAFFTIEEGIKTYSFVKEDGDYIPIWHNTNQKCQSPNNVTNNRTFIMENKIFDLEMNERIKQKLQISTITVLALVFVVLIVANFTLAGFLVTKNNQMDEKIHGSALKCAEETAKTNQNMVNFINAECVSKLIAEKEEEIKEEHNPSNIVPLTK